MQAHKQKALLNAIVDFRYGRTLSAGRTPILLVALAPVVYRPARFIPQESPPFAPINGSFKINTKI